MSEKFFIDQNLITKATTKVKEYNETPVGKRQSWLKVDFGADNSTLIEQDGEDEYRRDYMLEAIPIWANDVDEIDSLTKSECQKMADDYCNDMNYEKLDDCFKAPIKLVVCYQDYDTGENGTITLEDYAKMVCKDIMESYIDLPNEITAVD